MDVNIPDMLKYKPDPFSLINARREIDVAAKTSGNLDAMKKRATLETPSIQSLGRGLTILEAVAESTEPVALKQLTGLLGIDRSSIFRLANTLRQRRFLANPDGRKEYILGPSIWRLSRKYGRNVLIAFCREHLRTLSSTTAETAHLAVRDGAKALFIDCHVATGQVLTVSGQTGELVPLYATAHGKALLVDLDFQELETLLGSGPLHAYTRRTSTSIGDLARTCGRIDAAVSPATMVSSSTDCAAWRRRFATRTAWSSPRSASPRRRVAFRNRYMPSAANR